MKKMFVFANGQNPEAKREADEVVKRLTEMGASVFTHCADFGYGFDCIISVGGDGTFLRASKMALPFGVPILGLNVGRLGFMTELEVSETKLLSRLFTREYTIEKRMLLEVTVKDRLKAVAVNEAVVHMGDKSRILDLSLCAEEKQVAEYRADGLLFSTPTGSTGYALSAGGPIIEPHVECITAVPLCAHGLNARPIVFAANTALSVSLSHMEEKNAYLSVDGCEGISLSDTDTVSVSKAEETLKVIKLGCRSFYEQLGNKMKF